MKDRQKMRWFLAILVLVAGTVAAAAQSPAPSGPMSQPSARGLLIKGAACKRSDGGAGIVKQDACQRWYCGLASYKDPVDVVPDIDKRLNCSWKLVGQHCKCLPNSPRQ
jgi:hypothetical protein